MDLSRAIWRKSSYSNGSGGNCVEVTGLAWRKSSRSNGNGGECVETATGLPGIVAVRDSKNPAGPTLLLPPATWRAFLTSVKTGAHDL
jgi:Domain of unknown function (DUF397)